MAEVAHLSSQLDVHPLLRHPRPITRDSAKAQRMLGLISDSEEKLTSLHREKSKTTKWLERPMYAHLDVSDMESEKDEESGRSKSDRVLGLNDVEKRPIPLNHPSETGSRTSRYYTEEVEGLAEPKMKVNPTVVNRRPVPLQNLRPVSYHSQHLLTPDWTTSPATMSPTTQRQRPLSYQPDSPDANISSSYSNTNLRFSQRVHPQTWPAPAVEQQINAPTERPISYQHSRSSSGQQSESPLESPQLNERRPRPISFATFQNRDRRNSKIASSRGLRNNSYPNFSRPISGAPPRTIPGEHIESDSIYDRFADDEVGPPSPASPFQAALDGFESGNEKSKDEKKPRNRWSSIPQTFKRFARRRSSATAQEPPKEMKIDELRRMNLTEENLHWYDSEVSHSPAESKKSVPGVNPLPTPSYSPLEFKHRPVETLLPPPFAPWADGPPSPALTQEVRRGSDISMQLSPTKKHTRSQLSIENVCSRPSSQYSTHSSFAMPSPVRHIPAPQFQPSFSPSASPRVSSRRGTPSLERTCILCKTSREPADFVNRRVSTNCWHEPAICCECLRAHIKGCVETRGWEHCSCPECGEHMTYDDIGAFADDDTFICWED